jgi:hypothetical protein
LFLQISQNQKDSIARNQLTIEAISLVTKLYTENSGNTLAELRQIAVKEGFGDQFEVFFASST